MVGFAETTNTRTPRKQPRTAAVRPRRPFGVFRVFRGCRWRSERDDSPLLLTRKSRSAPEATGFFFG